MNFIQVTDINNPELSIFTKATEHQLMHINEPNAPGIFIAETSYIINIALDMGYEPVIALCDSALCENAVVLRLTEIPVYITDFSALKNITGFNLTEGLLCAMKRKEHISPEEICKGAKRIAILERVMNPTNVGAIMRSAAALGVDACILTPDCSDPFYRRASRVSRGSVFSLPWTYFPKGEPYKNIEFLKEQGFKTVAMALEQDSISIKDSRLKGCEKLAIVLGSEGDGLTEKSICACDYTAMIPMHRGIDSLNVAAASAVIFWELG